MRQIRYAEGAVLTSDALADAVMYYSRELARNGSADVVEVPVFYEGRRDVVKLLLGPASQLIDEPAPSDTSVPDDGDVIADIQRRIELLGPARPVPDDQPVLSTHHIEEL